MNGEIVLKTNPSASSWQTVRAERVMSIRWDASQMVSTRRWLDCRYSAEDSSRNGGGGTFEGHSEGGKRCLTGWSKAASAESDCG